jgi:hypothetical protein
MNLRIEDASPYDINPGKGLMASGFCGTFWFLGSKAEFTLRVFIQGESATQLLLLTIGRILPPSNCHDTTIVITRESEMSYSTTAATQYLTPPKSSSSVN